MAEPLVSILVTTYNRSRVLRRAIECVLSQTFQDYELVIIDDCSADDTQAVIRSFDDSRIRNIRNDVNVGSKLGDRAHKRRFVYELMRGKYFVNFCDDDFWLNSDLLARQIANFEKHENLAMVLGGQLTFMLDEHSEMPPLTAQNLSDFVDPVDYSSRDPRVHFQRTTFDNGFMSSDRFLDIFSRHPLDCNINGGAALMSRAHYVGAKALLANVGSQWQAGYEYFLGPACFGDVVYFNSPELVVEARPQNASFQWTQVDHYRDSVLSIEKAFEEPLAAHQLRARRARLTAFKKETIRNVSLGYLGNTLSILKDASLGICSEDNIRSPVTARHVLPIYLANGILPNRKDIVKMARSVAVYRGTWRRLGRNIADIKSKPLRHRIRKTLPVPVVNKLRAVRDLLWRGL